MAELRPERLDLNIVVIAFSCSHHEIDPVVIYFGSEYVASEQHELHFDEILGVISELKAVELIPSRSHVDSFSVR
jgi:hypothetical protein